MEGEKERGGTICAPGSPQSPLSILDKGPASANHLPPYRDCHHVPGDVELSVQDFSGLLSHLPLISLISPPSNNLLTFLSTGIPLLFSWSL